MRDHLEAVEKQLGKHVVEAPEFPEEAEYVWRWFVDLCAGRQVGMAASPLAWSEIAAYFRLRGERPGRWELTTIRTLDHMALSAMSKKNESKPEHKGQRIKPPPRTRK